MSAGDLVRLRRRFLLLTFLRWFPTGLLIPVLVLLLVARGLSLPAVGAVFAAYGLTVAALELPTGALADVLGRRAVLATATTLTVLGTVALAVVSEPQLLVVAVIVTAVARALDSGPLEAWYVDAAHEISPDVDLKPGLARAAAASAVGLALGALASGALVAGAPLPGDGPALLLSLSVPFLVAALLGGVHLGAILAWVRPPAPAPRAAGWRAVRAIPVTVAGGARLGWTSPVLRRLLARSAVLGVVLATAEILAPLRFDRDIGPEGYSALVTVAFLGTAVGARLGPVLARAVSGTGTGLLAATLLAAGALAGVALPGWPAAAAAYVLLYAALGLDDPLVGELLHAETTTAQRATVLSVASLTAQTGGVAGAVAVPALAATTSYAVAWCGVAVLLAAAALLCRGLPAGPRSGGEVSAAPVAVGP